MEAGQKLICAACSAEFMVTEEEAAIYEEYRLMQPPRRCPACRGTTKALVSAVRPPKEMYPAVCDLCGEKTQLPFKPKGDKPVLCQECFKRQRTVGK